MDFTPEEIKLIEERRAKLAKRNAPKGKLAQLRASLMEAMSVLDAMTRSAEFSAKQLEQWPRWQAALDATAVSVVRKKKQTPDTPKEK